jgi:hypothetical protein
MAPHTRNQGNLHENANSENVGNLALVPFVTEIAINYLEE